MSLKNNENETDDYLESDSEYPPSNMWNQPSAFGQLADFFKNPLSWFILGGIFLAIALFSFFSGDQATDLSDKIAELESKLVYLEATINSMGKTTAKETLDQKALLDSVYPLKERVDMLEEKLALFMKDLNKKLEQMGKKQVVSVTPYPAAAKPKKDSKKTGSIQYYTVQKGDTLYSISKKYGLTVAKMRELNGIKPGQPLMSGQKLRVTP
jgi:uncharacterized coiled-coil protein SlyX